MNARKGRPSRLQLPDDPIPPVPLQKAAFARWLKCAPARVTEWTAKRILTAPAVQPDGLIRPQHAAEQLIAAGVIVRSAGSKTHTPTVAAGAILPARNSTRGTPAGQNVAPPSYDVSRAEHEALKVKLAGLDLAERRGDLVPRALADAVLFDACRALRDAWLNWPARVAAVMASRLKIDPALLMRELDGQVKAQLAAIADPSADWRTRSKEANGAIVA